MGALVPILDPNFIEESVSTVTSLLPYLAPFLIENHVASLVHFT
jgi:hypothetical protein